MALKTKGGFTAKAGSKRKTANEEELKRLAIEENRIARPRVNKRGTSRVNTYRYKEPEPAKEQKVDGNLYYLREPKAPSPFDQFRASLPAESQVFARMYWQMECSHAHEEAISQTSSFTQGVEPVFLRCEQCGLVRKWLGTKTATKMYEWACYCPDGFDMFDWQDLYTKDRSIWRFIHDEVLAEMVSEAMTTEEAA